MGDKQVTLTVTVDQLNTLLTGLAQMPYGQVFQLINNIQEQIKPQMQQDAAK